MSEIVSWMEAAGCQRVTVSGEHAVSTCPFHEGSVGHTGRCFGKSFAMNLRSGLFICYSASCGAQGDLAKFLREGLGWSELKAKDAAYVYGAVRSAAMNEDVDEWMPAYEDRHVRVDVKRRLDTPATEQMVMVYEALPDYMKTRFFSDEIMRKWEVGYDVAAERIVLPVRDQGGHLVGFTKRGTKKWHKPKYLHLDFAKGEYLYGLHLGKYGSKAWRSATRICVTEGQLDALALDQLSSAFVVSTMGARVTNTQMKLLRGYKEVYLYRDMDDEGDAWTTKIGEYLMPFYPPNKIQVVCHYRGYKDVADLLIPGRWFDLKFKSYENWRLNV